MNRPTYFAICIAEPLWIMAETEVDYACKFTPNSFLECFDHVPLRFYFFLSAFMRVAFIGACTVGQVFSSECYILRFMGVGGLLILATFQQEMYQKWYIF